MPKHHYTPEEAAEVFAPVYYDTDWKWGWADPQVPDARGIAHTIRELVAELQTPENLDTTSISTGGLTVTRRDNGALRIALELGYLQL